MSRKVLSGVVVSANNSKTIKVRVERLLIHSLYKKVIKSYKNYMVHDELEKFNAGDVVRIQEHRPLSARKRWIVLYS